MFWCSRILTFHAEARADLLKLSVLPLVDLLVSVLAEEHPVVPVDEGYHTLAGILGHREQVLQNVAGLGRMKKGRQGIINLCGMSLYFHNSIDRSKCLSASPTYCLHTYSFSFSAYQE